MPTDPAQGSPPPSEVLGGRYRLLEPVGRGGMSVVYRAKDTALGRMVAVKVIQHDPAGPVELKHMRERFRREAANAAGIPPHPNVVQIYDYGTDPAGDRDFIVMELLEGRDLKTVLAERRFDAAEAVEILQQAARGVAAGHRAGIVHRDVKPANLLLVENTSPPTVRVLDFGIAKALRHEAEDDDLTRISGIPHTPAYASPEQRQEGGTVGPASDVYQLGLLAVELLTGSRAFDEHERERIARGEVVAFRGGAEWERIPPAVREVVECALRHDETERYPDATLFAEALAGAREEQDRTLAAPPEREDSTLAGGAATLPPARPVPAPSGDHPLRRLPVGAWLAAAALIALLLLWGVTRSDRDTADSTAWAPDRPDAAELEEAFAPLYGEAAERLAEQEAGEEP